MGALGKAPDAAGNGLTPLEHRRLIWADYHSFGIVKGCEVSGTAGMAYRVSPGKVVMETSRANREAVEVPVPAVEVATLPAPTSGSRTDYVLVDSDGQVHVRQANDETMFALSVRAVPAGVTATTATTARVDRDHAVSMFGSLGVIDRWDEALGHRVAIPNERRTIKTGRFVLPADRRLMFDFRHSACEAGYTDPIRMPMSAEPTGATLYTLSIDNQVKAKLTFYHSKMWETKTDEVDFWVTAGEHTWALQRERWISTGTGAITLGNGDSDIPPSYCKIVDQGSTR
ncbi:hypothetical protein [Brachybacterium sp. UMB0905]|uniref:hypothetical protein n=1 Tax=Brachybacterium sp. UMB0905 TaxID=2069310 RepID=UPI000C80C562|nr:hypothetical protein [Brachybacterium sp. UMB0905]PMC74232.1 hypothetical protein CJ197_14625 [Brachybacterium sp. UMB0905]